MESNYSVEWKDKTGSAGWSTTTQVKAESDYEAVQKVKKIYPSRFGEVVKVRKM